MIDNETKKHGIQDNISPQKSEDTKPIKHKSTANDKSIPCYESVAAQMLKRGMRLGAWAISKGMQEDLNKAKEVEQRNYVLCLKKKALLSLKRVHNEARLYGISPYFMCGMAIY